MPREYQIENPGNRFFDMLLQQMMQETGIAPYNTNPTERGMEQKLRGIAGEKEDQALRGALGGSRKLERGQGGPPGSYAGAKFPGMEHQLWAQESGFLPKGFSWRSMLDESPQERQMREGQQQQWAAQQRRMLGMPPAGGQGRIPGRRGRF